MLQKGKLIDFDNSGDLRSSMGDKYVKIYIIGKNHPGYQEM